MSRLRQLLNPRGGLILLALGLVLGIGAYSVPLLLRGPQLLRSTPINGADNLNPRSELRLEFDQPLQGASLQGAVRIEPALDFEISTQGSVITLRPRESFSYGANYTLSIDGSIRNLLGRSMAAPVQLSFATLPYVAISAVTPGDGADGLAANAPLSVEFSAPVVSVEQVQAAADDPRLAEQLPQPLLSDPPTPGVGRWLSPTRFSFAPTNGWSAATSYTLTIPKELAADGSAALAQPFSWSFRTGATVLAGTRPYDTQVDVAAESAIELRLARDVDGASLAERFTLTAVGERVAVAGTIRSGEGTFSFQPTTPLARGVRYEAKIAPGVQAISGAAINSEPLTWSFTVMGDLRVDEVIPPPDATEVPTTTRQIAVVFNHPVVAITTPTQQAELPQLVTIDPPLQGEGRWLDTRTFVFSPTVALDPATSYTLSIAAGLRDQTGGQLRQPYSWRFTTLTPQVYGSLPANGDRFAGPTLPLTVVFNQSMDLESLRTALSLRAADGTRLPGNLVLAPDPVRLFRSDAPVDEDPYVSGFAVTFTPAAPLERGATYTLEVSSAARATNGVPLSRAYKATFQVAPLPSFISSRPADASQLVLTGEPIVLTFSAPLDWSTLEASLTIEPETTAIYTSTNENEIYLYTDLVPETRYQVTIAPTARDPYGATIGQETTFSFTTAPLDPMLYLAAGQRIAVYSSYTTVRVPVQTINVPQVNFAIYQLAQAELPTWIAASQDDERWRGRELDPATLVASAEVRPEGGRNRTELSLLAAGDLAPGAYVIEIRGAGLTERQLMIVSPYTLTIKRSANRLFVWAVDLADGQPVRDLMLQGAVYNYERSELEGVTDLGRTAADGVLNTAFPSSAERSVYSPLFIWSPAGPMFTMGGSNWSDGIDAWSFSLPMNLEQPPLVGSLNTDRPLYRPGDTVHVRGIVRLDDDARYNLPAPGSRVALQISDPNGTMVFSSTLALSDFGSFAMDLPLANSALTGYYNLLAHLDGAEASGTVYGNFSVAEYRKPVFELSVTPSREDLLPGEQLEATLEARYFAGGVLSDAPVRWRLLSAPFYFSADVAPGYMFQDLDDAYEAYRWFEESRFAGDELVADGEGVTDSQGRLVVRLPAELGKSRSSRTLTLDMEVTDIDGQVIAAQANLRLHAGAFYIGVRPEGYVAEIGKPQSMALITLDPQGQPVADRDLEVGIYSREWYSVREQGPDGRFYFTSAFTDTLLQSIPARTDATGRTSVSFTPTQGGSYRIGVTGKDAAGREVRASAFTWAYGGEVFWGVNSSNRVDLIADRTSYTPGDTARILIPAPYRGSSALVTIERGEVLEHRTITLAGSSELLEVPISAAYAPNVYVSVVLITPAGSSGVAPSAPDLRVGLINLPVSNEQQQLTVAVSTDRAQAGPRDRVTYTVTTTDYTGKGVPAEVDLALVDKAVLSLAADMNPSLEQAFYQRRPLGVLTAQSITLLADRVVLALQADSKGGGGGADLASAPRRDFPDTAYWNPSLVTGSDGQASITLDLPDSLTTWQMRARAVTRETLVGQGTSELVATRPLLVRPALPRFLTVGDQPMLGAVVQNQTARAIDAQVTLELITGEGEAPALRLDDSATQQLRVEANSQVIVRWRAEAVGSTPTRLRLRVNGDGLEDALEIPLTIQRFTTPETSATAGQVLDQVVETLGAPAGAEGEIVLELTSSLAAGLRGGLDYLESFPYACVEQTVSSFLPNAVTYRLLKQLGEDDPELRASLERNLTAGLQSLYLAQNLDGGWGWWAGDPSDPYLTAYAIQGLGEAIKAGYGVDQVALQRGLDYLTSKLNQQSQEGSISSQLNVRAYILFVLSELEQADRGRTVALFEQQTQLDRYGRAYLLMALERMGDDERVAALVGDLSASAIMRPTDAHWEEVRPDYATMSSNTRTTALVLQALVRAEPTTTLIPNAVRYLMGLREGGHWRTTQESATSMLALAEYLAQSGELRPDYRYRVTLGDETLSEGRAADLAAPLSLSVSLANLPQGNTTALSLQRQAAAGESGQGRLYYTLRMQRYQDAATVEALDRGVRVEREYALIDPVTLNPTGQRTNEAALGDLVQVRLTINLPEDMPYFMVEDMLPAGLEAVDSSLKTSSAVAADPTLEQEARQERWWYFGRTEVRDNRVALFATNLPRGTYVYSYLARATTAGTFQALPATAMRTYAPEVFGRSAGASFMVTMP